MSEKRFTFDYEVEFEIFDRVTKKHYDGRVGCQEKICDLLNEQQEHITHLEDTNDNFRIKLIEDIEVMEQAEKKIGEQQATIRRLQDLCGESDGENAKLRIENKKLKAKLKEKEEDERLYANEIVELRKTNEEWLQFKELGGDY